MIFVLVLVDTVYVVCELIYERIIILTYQAYITVMSSYVSVTNFELI